MKIIADKEGKSAIENLLVMAIQIGGFDATLDLVQKIQKSIQLMEDPKPVTESNTSERPDEGPKEGS